MNVQSIVESPKNLHVGRHFDGLAEDGPQLLELRTDSGSVYVRLSQWQRIRLLWTFRHFHVLPPQVLSRRDQHLIEGLSRSARVPLPLPAASNIIGVVEMRSIGGTARQGARTGAASPQALPWKPLPGKPLSEKPLIRDEKLFNKESAVVAIKQTSAVRGGSGMSDNGFQQWKALGMLAAVGVLVILVRFYSVTLPTRTAPRSEAPAVSRPAGQAASARVSSPAALLPAVEKPKPRVAARAATPVASVPAPSVPALAARKAPPVVALEPSVTGGGSAPVSAESAVTTPSAAADRLFVSQLPQGNFARPVVSDPDLVGEVELKALIGADGSVEEVSFVKGNPKLAQAGLRAVRRWHYSQEQGLGREAEALIRMNFFGPDAISVTSLAR
jgi:Gram-negative bacterial TonB protein C-terminal